MIRNLKNSYENIGTSSYMTVVFTEEAGLIQYRLEMLVANEIDHVLPVSKRMADGETIAYYNISSKMSLDTILERKKLKKEELIRILRGAVDASREVTEYQLAAEDLVMEPEYIFVDPATFEPAFVYLPVTFQGGRGLRELILDLVMQGKIELSNDNFVQVLLEAVSSLPFSLEKLEQCLKTQNDTKKTVPRLDQAPAPVPPVKVETAANFPKADPAVKPIPPAAPIPPATPVPQEAPIPKVVPTPKPARKPEPKPEPKCPPASPKGEEQEGGFDPEKAKKMFLLPQAAVMVIVAALISFEVFIDKETGAVMMNAVLAAVILIGVFEVVLYREAYVNSKKKSGKKKAASKQPKEVKAPKSKKAPAVPKEQPVPTIPKKTISGQEPVSQPVPAPQEEAIPQPVPVPRPVSQPAPQIPMPQTPVFATPQNEEPSGADETDIMGADQGSMTAFLQYFDNGIVRQIPLEKPSMLLGRLSGQVDFVISNPRIGKVHAEILNQNGMFFVKDLNSKNGTYINRSGQRINSNVPYPLNNNDTITLADTEFTLHCPVRS